jgi:hypothetical protein
MPRGTAPGIIAVLRTTLLRLENSDEFAANEPAMKELKTCLVRALADMEIRKATEELEKAS